MESVQSTAVLPTSTTERIQYLDVLRGIAIFFIFVANVEIFSGWIAYAETINATSPGARINDVLVFLSTVFVLGKFYSIFSILFGIGFVLQFQKAQSKGRPFVPFFRRRMLGLLLFGLVHLFFLWLGDILTLYALLGFVLIYTRHASDKKILKWAGILILLPIVNLVFLVLSGGVYPFFFAELLFNSWDAAGLPPQEGEGIARIFASLGYMVQTESISELFTINLRLPLSRLTQFLFEGRFFKVFACFLIGVWAGRHILNHGLLDNTPLLKKIMYWGYGLGLPMNVFMYYCNTQQGDLWGLIYFIPYAFGVVPLACAYAATLALIMKRNNKAFSWFAPVGRTALTNYLLQTVISIGIFYGIGLGLGARTPLWASLLVVCAVFAIQIVLSQFWLHRYTYGPLEWLWRRMTYGMIKK